MYKKLYYDEVGLYFHVHKAQRLKALASFDLVNRRKSIFYYEDLAAGRRLETFWILQLDLNVNRFFNHKQVTT